MITLTPTGIERLDDFFGFIQIRDFKANLRNLLLYYLINETEELPEGYGHFIEEMQSLLDCLDVIESEVSGNTGEKWSWIYTEKSESNNHMSGDSNLNYADNPLNSVNSNLDLDRNNLNFGDTNLNMDDNTHNYVNSNLK